MHLDHVALLVASIESAAGRVPCSVDLLGPIETFPHEGTREQYIGPAKASARLLLIQPSSAGGPYASALRRRGPGLHHIALKAPDVKTFVTSLSGSGWFLLPQSLRTIEQSNSAWLARAGTPFLVEVMAGEPGQESPFVALVELPVHGQERLLTALATAGASRMDGLQASPDQQSWLTIDSQRLAVPSLVKDD